MLVKSLVKFEKWIKIRIGEPLTAVDSNESFTVFGSITGYVGTYCHSTSQVKYLPGIQDEIIRSLYLTSELLQVIVGDAYALIWDPESNSISKYQFQRKHKLSTCSCSQTLASKTRVIILIVAPTQNKDIGVDIAERKNDIYYCDLQGKQESMICHIEMPTLFVPFEFDGNKLLIVEFSKEDVKLLSQVTFQPQPIKTLLLRFNHRVESVSHVRFYEEDYIYVENHNILKRFRPSKNQNYIIKITQSDIIALDVNQKQQISVLDCEGNIIVMDGENETYNFNILRLQQFPLELKAKKYLFELGYPYYIKNNELKIIVTCDFGLLIFALIN